MNKVLVIGGGGREHALIKALNASPQVAILHCLPGNGGILQTAIHWPYGIENISTKINLVVIGPEGPIVEGLADRLRKKGISVVGPSAEAAKLESSKAFAKDILSSANIPTAPYLTTTSPEVALAYIEEVGGRHKLVIKADGLCGGKGVVVCNTQMEARAAVINIMERDAFGEAGRRVVIEKRLEGREVSLMAMVTKDRVVMLPAAEDHKAVFDGDKGPNTGGMGAYSPSPYADDDFVERVRTKIVIPVRDAMAARGTPYRGFLYIGLMVVPGEGPYVLEFNCRLGDPETQVILPRIDEDIYPWLKGLADDELPSDTIKVSKKHAVCVVQCARKYPEKPETGQMIVGLEEAALMENVTVYHAGTLLDDTTGRHSTNGGRVLGVTALGDTLEAARTQAYAAVSCISWPGEHHRTDIAARK